MAAGMGRAAFAVLVIRSAALLGWMRLCAAQSEVVGPPAPLVAPLGGEVVLPCSLQPAVDVYGLTVEWARPDLRPKYVSVWRDGEELQANENPAFSGRKSLFTEELRRGNISLKLSDLRPSDQGSYRCYVPNLDGLAIVDLLVVDPGSSRTAVWLAVLPVVGVLAAVTALWVLWRRTRLKRKKQQDAEAGGEESRGRPLLEGGDQQDEDRSKENSSQVQLHTVTPAAEHLDPQNQEEGKHGEKEEKKKQSLEQKIQQKEREENKWGDKVSRLEKQIEDRENQISELDQQLQEVEIQLKNTEEDLKKTEEQTETPQEEKEKAVKALSDRREELQKKKEDVQKKLEKPEKEIRKMKKELDVMTGRKYRATAEKTELKRELEKLREAEASSSQTEEQRTLSTHNASGQQEAAD
ncbi:uncharacterized protein ACNS7B_021117 [Menidia menidia]